MANGGFIGKRLVPTIASAAGAWNANELYNARLDGIWPSPIVEVLTDFLIIAGGGGGGNTGSKPGGGAGGYLNSYGSEASGRNSASLSTLSLQMLNIYAVTIGAGGSANNNGSNTTFSGNDSSLSAISYTALGGGAGHHDGDGNPGGSGGAGGVEFANSKNIYSAGSGTSNQGFDGGVSRGIAENAGLCNAIGGSFCESDDQIGAGGGGAGAVGTSVAVTPTSSLYSGAGGAGLASSITGTSVTRAAGGSGRGTSNSNGYGFSDAAMPTGSGPSSNGGGGRGGSTDSSGGNGIIILRYPNTFSLANPGGGLTISTAATGSDKVSSITAGTGNIQFGTA